MEEILGSGDEQGFPRLALHADDFETTLSVVKEVKQLAV